MSNAGLTQQIGDFFEYKNLSANALNAFLLPLTDVSLFRSFSLQLSGSWTATLQVQVSNDGVNFINATVLSVNTPTGGASNISAPGIYMGPVCYRYMQIQVTAFTSGPIPAVVELYTTPFTATSVLAAAGSASIGQVAQGAGASSYANTWAVQQSLTNKPIAVGAANTVVKAFPGSLCTIVVTATGTTGFTVFDNPTTNSGTILYQSVGAPQVGSVVNIFGAALTGITVQNTATGPALTVYYS